MKILARNIGLHKQRAVAPCIFRIQAIENAAGQSVPRQHFISIKDREGAAYSIVRIDNGAPVKVAVLETVDQNLGGGNIGGHRDVMYIADAQQIRAVGL